MVNVNVSVVVDGIEHSHHHRPKLHLKAIGPFSEQLIPPRPVGVPKVIKLGDTQKVSIEYGAPVDKKGAPAKYQTDSVKWGSTDTSVVAVVPDTVNPFKAELVAGLPGITQVTLQVDGDIGDGTTIIAADPQDVTVESGPAVGFGQPTVGAPEEQ